MPRYPLLADVLAARASLRGIALDTPLEPSPELAAESGAAEVRLKLESVQPVGSFKTRGAHNKLALLAASRELEATQDALDESAADEAPAAAR